MTFDEFLKSINDWGKFQKLKYTIICLTYMLPAIMVYTYTFTAAIPNFRCQNPSNIFEDYSDLKFNEEYRPTKEECSIYKKSLSLKECQRCFVRLNDSRIESCQSYVYDKTYYKDTLTEEVKPYFLFSKTK